MTIYAKYGLFTMVSIGLYVGVDYWYEHRSPFIYGQDIAECQGAYNERYAATLYNEEAPAYVIRTNSTAIQTNATVSVGMYSGFVEYYSVSPETFTVTPETWQEPHYFTISATASPSHRGRGASVQVSAPGLSANVSFYMVVNSAIEATSAPPAVVCTPYVEAVGDFTLTEMTCGCRCIYDSGSLTVKVELEAEPEWTYASSSNATVGVWSFKKGNESIGSYMLWANLWNIMSGFKILAGGYDSIHWLTDSAIFDAAAASGSAIIMEYNTRYDSEALPFSSPGPGYVLPTNISFEASSTQAIDFVSHFRVMDSLVSNSVTPASFKYFVAASHLGGALYTNVAGFEWYGVLPEVADLAPFADVAWVKVEEADVPYSPQGNVWTSMGLHTNLPWSYLSAEYYRPGAVEDTTNVIYNKFITTNKLDAIRALATNMTCSIVRLTTEHVASADVETEQWTGSTPFGGDYETIAEAFAAAEFEYETDSWTVTNSSSGLGGNITHSAYAELVQTDTSYTETIAGYTGGCAGFNGTFSGSSEQDLAYYSGSGSRAKASNVLLYYPSAWAVTNGLVSRVRIFGVFSYPSASSISARQGPDDAWDFTVIGGLAGPFNDVPWYETREGAQSQELDQTQPDALAAQVFGSGVVPCKLQEAPSGYKHTEQERWVGEAPVAEVIVTLLKDTGAGGSVTGLDALKFDIGVDENDPANPATAGWQGTSTEWAETYSFDGYMFDQTGEDEKGGCDIPNGDTAYLDYEAYSTEHTEYYLMQQTLSLEYFLVVVDWNFKHLSATPYEPPSANTPAWATRTNAPSVP